MSIDASSGRVLGAPRTRFIAPVLLMLLLVLGQSVYWVNGPKGLAHALDHEKAGPTLALERHHDHVSHGEGLAESDAPTEVEHKLLHEMEHIQVVPLYGAPQRVLFDAALIVMVVLVCVARRSPERSFRPPRPVF